MIIEGFYHTSTTRLNKRDTVRAYLRNITTPFAVIDSAKSVVDSVNYTGNFLFSNAPTGTYYIQLKHRNALETWSKAGGQAYTLGSALIYDFTDNITKAYGSNMAPVGTKFGLFSGDVTQDGTVDATDVSLIDNDAVNFVSGYVVTDITGDNFVDASDFSIADNNAANFVSVSRP